MNRLPYLIIGNSIAAFGCVQGIRAVDPEAQITLMANEPDEAYSRPLITYLLADKVNENRMRMPLPDTVAPEGIQSLLGVKAVRVDTDLRAIETAGGQTYPFEKLLIACGGKPIRPRGVTGLEADGVFTCTTIGDARRIKDYVTRNHAHKALVIGGGLIGLKSVEALLALEIQTTLVELADRILSASFDETASQMARTALEKAGVRVLTGTTVSQVGHNRGRVTTALLREGTSIDCDMVILAIGVTPDIALVADSAIETDRGILVDEHMQTSMAGIYAAGDVAQATDLLHGIKRTIPILPMARRQGVIAGRNMAGDDRLYQGGMAMNAVDLCGVATISMGITAPAEEDCEILTTGDGHETYKKIVLRNNRIIGAIFVGRIDRAGITTGLIQRQVDVSGFKHLLLTDDFGLISLPAEYRKHMVTSTRVSL